MDVNNMLEEIKKINSLNPNHIINDNTIMEYYNIHLFLYELIITLSRSNKKGGGVNTLVKNISSGINDISRNFMNELDKLANSNKYLILFVYENMIFRKLSNFSLNDKIELTKRMLNHLAIEYKRYNPTTLYLGGKRKYKKGGSYETILISGIIIGAIWSLIQIFDRLFEYYKNHVADSKKTIYKPKPKHKTMRNPKPRLDDLSPRQYRPVTEAMKKIQEEADKKSPTLKKKGRTGIFARLGLFRK